MKKDIKYWQHYLGIDQWEVTTIEISKEQVSDENCKTGLSFVGVVPYHDTKQAEIYHTRIMSDEDIVHELLHVKHPLWSEDQVNFKTAKILLRKSHSKRDGHESPYNKKIPKIAI